MNLFVPLMFIIWRLVLDFVAIVASSSGWKLASWANWDGGHYLALAQSGYKEFYQAAFFPLYPLLVRLFSFFVDRNLTLAGFIISNLAFLLGLYFTFAFVSKLYGEGVARRTVFYLIVFPTSFFFGGVYSESLFFLFMALTFLWAFEKRWFGATLAAFAASLTRFAGIFLFFFLVAEYFSRNKLSIDSVKKSLVFLLVPFGLGIYLLYQWWVFGSPMAFVFAQKHWQRSFVPFWDTLSVYFSNITSYSSTNYFSSLSLIELSVTLLFLALSVIAFYKLPFSLATFGLLSIIPPLFASNFASMPRYVLSLLPAFILLGRWGKNPFIHIGIVLLFTSFFIQFLVSFLYGFWLA